MKKAVRVGPIESMDTMVRISSEHLYVSLAISVLLIMGSTGNSAILRPDEGNEWKE
jgi:hypothetical protein